MANPYEGFSRKTPGQVAKAGGYAELAYILIFIMMFLSGGINTLPFPSFFIPAVFVLMAKGGAMFFGYAFLSGMNDYIYAAMAIFLGAVLFAPGSVNTLVWACLTVPQIFIIAFGKFLASPGIIYALLILIFVTAFRQTKQYY